MFLSLNAFSKDLKKVVAAVALAALLAVLLPQYLLAKETPSRKIVVFSGALNEAAKDELVSAVGGVKLKKLSLVNGAAVWLPNRASELALTKAAGVVRLDDDVAMFALATQSTQPAQVLPWGVDRIDADLVWPTGNNADAIKVGIIDTGISKDHPDLKANIKGGVNTINPVKGWNDDNGHGSHVAGIVAALNNTIGVVGAAPLADLYAIKVLDRNGSGWLSDIIEGLQWSVANGMQVVNMSLGTTSNVQSLHDAVAAAQAAGAVVVAAAGNNGGAVIYPAAYPEVIAVSATDQNNVLASWSSRGPEVDLSAPGVSILSSFKDTGYATLSGTSMAAPHVTGAAALVMSTPVGAFDANGNGRWDPAEVQKKLQDRATDLGDVGFDNLYGWGLVNAYQAVQP